MSEKPSPDEVAIWQRRLASQANNRAWTLSESLSRTPEEDDEMLQAQDSRRNFASGTGAARRCELTPKRAGRYRFLVVTDDEGLAFTSTRVRRQAARLGRGPPAAPNPRPKAPHDS